MLTHDDLAFLCELCMKETALLSTAKGIKNIDEVSRFQTAKKAGMEQLKKTDSMERARIYDRIFERCFPVEVAGGSRRRKIVRESYADMKALLGL